MAYFKLRKPPQKPEREEETYYLDRGINTIQELLDEAAHHGKSPEDIYLDYGDYYILIEEDDLSYNRKVKTYEAAMKEYTRWALANKEAIEKEMLRRKKIADKRKAIKIEKLEEQLNKLKAD